VDVKFTMDVLSGRKEMEVKEQRELFEIIAMVKGSNIIDNGIDFSNQWTNRVSKLVNSLESELDPIDVAFYQPHLKQCVQKCYKRSNLLLGSLVQFNKIYAKVRQNNALQEQHNVLVLAPLVTRFSVLPISTPTRSTQIPSEGRNPASPMMENDGRLAPTSQSFVDKLGSMFTGEKKIAEKGKDGLQNLWFL